MEVLNSSGSAILYLYSEINFSQKESLSVINLDTTVIFPPAILGPEMAAPILWAPGIFLVLSAENPHANKIPPLRGRFWFF